MLADTYGDLSHLPPYSPLPPPLRRSNAVKSSHETLVQLGGQPGMTVGKLYKIMAGASGHNISVGTAADIADIMQDWFEAGGCGGWNVMPAYLPDPAVAIFEELVPVLQRRGLFHTQYEGGSTLRGSLVVHGYVLLHFVLLSSKARIFDEQLRAQIDDAEVRERLRRQLPINIFVQFLAGPREVRHGLIGFLLRLIAWITLMIGPITLLVFFELQFVPYRDVWVTMWQRIAVVIDLLLLWLLWPAVVSGETTRRGWRSIGWGTGSAMVCISLMSVVLVFAIATFRGEWLEAKFAWFPLRHTLVVGTVDLIALKPTSLWSSRLVLPGFDVIDHAKFDT